MTAQPLNIEPVIARDTDNDCATQRQPDRAAAPAANNGQHNHNVPPFWRNRNERWRGGNTVELLINGEMFFPQVFASIRAARREVLIETFILWEDDVGHQLQRALIAAAKRGVRVELTIDDYGTADLSDDFVNAMTDAGVRLHRFEPTPRLLGLRINVFRRLHRKLVVIDGVQAFIGGINYCGDQLESFGTMAKQDYALRVRGPVVQDIHETCLALLQTPVKRNPRPRAQERVAQRLNRGLQKRAQKKRLAIREKLTPVDRRTTRLPQIPVPAEKKPHGFVAEKVRALLTLRDNTEHRHNIERHYMHAIAQAKERLVLAHAYFFPGYRLLRAIRDAARRGVEVTLLLQGQPDMPWVMMCSRMLYGYLMREGVTIYEYCQRPLHGKLALADRHWATVGSSNLDPLSLSLNLEANLVIEDTGFNQQLHKHLLHLTEFYCEPMDIKLIKRSYWWRMPFIFLTFHFLRYFPAIAGWFPAHAPELKLVQRK